MRVEKSEKSYAKINLHLHIGAKREDGYHPLSSLFHVIDLYDLITIEVKEQNVTQIDIMGMQNVPLTQNLMYKAASLFLTTLEAKAKITIHIKKNIPMQGGLGGGSSNAATILLLLQQIYNYPLSNEHLYALGLTLGSDVPFFLYQKAAAFVEGRGEVVTPIDAREDLSVVLTIPRNFGVSTKQAFDDLDRTREEDWREPRPPTMHELCHMYNDPVENWGFYNDFNNIMFLYNDLYNILDILDNEGLKGYTSISGSGSTFFTITDNGSESTILSLLEEKYRTQVINNLTTCLYLL